jgi:hypothetical protein
MEAEEKIKEIIINQNGCSDSYKTHRNYIILIVIIILFFGIREWLNMKNENKLVSNIANYSDTVKLERLKNGALVETNSSLILNTEKEVRILASHINDTVAQMLKKFQSLSNVTYVTNKFYAGNDTIKYETKIPCYFPPFKVRRGTDTTYRFVGTIGQDYFAVDSLSILDNQTLVFGRKKVGFMKYDNVVDINHSNSLMKSTNIKDYKYVPKKKWYERTVVHLGEGAILEELFRIGGNFLIKSITR